VNRIDVEEWVVAYERAWRSPGVDQLAELFTDDTTYLASPWRDPIGGRDALAEFWDAERDGPDEEFALRHRIVAVDEERRTAVVRVEVDYGSGSRWRDLWVIRFATDGRCAAFEEWPFSPRQPDGH
jgi:ketosteroid isomerase-like protein